MSPPSSPSYSLFLLLSLSVFKFNCQATTAGRFSSLCPSSRCGNINITYPFWPITESNSTQHCGYRGFGLYCSYGDVLIFHLAGGVYQVTSIDYDQHKLALVDFDVKLVPTCPRPRHNLPLESLPALSYSNLDLNLSFYFNCSNTPNYSGYLIGCLGFELKSSYVFVEGREPEGIDWDETCEQKVVTAVMSSEIDENHPTEDFVWALNAGFMLDWRRPAEGRSCEAHGGLCGFNDTEPLLCICPNSTVSTKPCKTQDRRRLGRKLGIGFGAAGGTLLLVVAFLMFRRWRRRTHSDTSSSWASKATSYPSSNTDIEKAVTNYGVQIFRYKDLAKATSNFDSNKELGDGGFGTVHKGKLRDGREVAVKRLFEHNYRRVEQFLNEIEILARLHHQNLVTLYGCTSPSSRELLLVYEYIPNGTVADHLHGEQAKPGSLSWTTRMRIAVETASALAYLHASEVVHRDVKTSNILLDSYFHVKVADFGLSRLFPTHVTHVSTAPQGTPGYVDPEYHQCYHLTNKSDVYSFGVVLVELISSKPAVDLTRHRHEINLSNMAINKIQNHELHELVDPYLGFESDFKTTMMISEVAELAFRCLQNDRDMRPSMAEVLETLNEIQSEDYCTEKAEVVDIPSEDVVQIQSDPPTVLLDSGKTTPQDSS